MNEVIESYYNKYGKKYQIGRDFCGRVIRQFGDSKAAYHFLEFINNVTENCPNYMNRSFDDIVRDYNISQAYDV